LNDFASSDVTHMEHKLILDGILRKDLSQAERALEIHIRRTRVTLAEHKELFND
jgi:DNA-binding GntR family transcriptional regulator